MKWNRLAQVHRNKALKILNYPVARENSKVNFSIGTHKSFKSFVVT